MNISKMLAALPPEKADAHDDAAAFEKSFDQSFDDVMHDAFPAKRPALTAPEEEATWFQEGDAAQSLEHTDDAVPGAVASTALESMFFGEAPLDLKQVGEGIPDTPIPPVADEGRAPPFDPADFDDDMHLLMMSSLSTVLPPPGRDGPAIDAPLGRPTRAGGNVTSRALDHVTLNGHPEQRAHALPLPSLEDVWAAPRPPSASSADDEGESDAHAPREDMLERGEPARKRTRVANVIAQTQARVARQPVDSSAELLFDNDRESTTQTYEIDTRTPDDGTPATRRESASALFSQDVSAVSIPRALSAGALVAATEIARVLEAAMLDLSATAADEALADISVAMNKERATIRVGGQNGDAGVELEVQVDGDKVLLTTDAHGRATLSPRRDELVAELADAGFTFSGFSDAEDRSSPSDERDHDDPARPANRRTPASPTNAAPGSPGRAALAHNRSVLA